MSERAVPFHCPYCGEGDLWPFEGGEGWECRSCLRAFTVRMLGMVRPTGRGPGAADGEGAPS